ncbi:MAG: hypothetical protein WA057_06390 [Candidatus Magasanikiibacteriota bacterium]
MKKYFFFTIILTIIFGSALIAQAMTSSKLTSIPDKTSPRNADHWLIEIEIAKGWNLLPEGGFSGMDLYENNDLSNILTPFYVYAPSVGRYITTSGGYKDADYQIMAQNRDYLQLSPMWIYFKQPAKFTLEVSKDAFTRPVKLHAGWNFISIVPQFSQGGLTIGNCEFEKMYLWNPTIQNWEKTNIDILQDVSYAGYAMVVKTKAECALNKELKTLITNVPALPDEVTLELEAKKRDEQRISEMRRIQTSLELYYQNNHKYPLANSAIILGSKNYTCLGENGFEPAGCEKPYQFMNPVPSDPLSPQSNYTYVSNDGQTYKMNFYLETNGSALGFGKIQATPSGIQRDQS